MCRQQGSEGKGKENHKTPSYACVKVNVSNSTVVLACMVVSDKKSPQVLSFVYIDNIGLKCHCVYR